MRIVVAPDEYKSSLSAVEAARAIVAGWAITAPNDEFDLCPLSDGGPGFVDTMHAAVGGELLAVTVTGPTGEPTPAVVLMVGKTAYLESAQACGSQLIDPAVTSPASTTTFGVGELIAEAIGAGATKVVIGLGGSSTNDAGAGMLAALGASADSDLHKGGRALAAISKVDLSPAVAALSGVEVIAATDVDSPLLGLTGATNVFAPQKGADQELVMVLEGALENFSRVIGRRADGKDPAVALGAGAAGGLGYGLMHLGATRAAGIATVATAVGFADRVAKADLVVTGEGRFDWQSMRGKVVSGVAAEAMRVARPCVVIAGQVVVGRREYSAIGVSSAYSVSEMVGSVEASLADPAGSLAQAAKRVASTWSH